MYSPCCLQVVELPSGSFGAKVAKWLKATWELLLGGSLSSYAVLFWTRFLTQEHLHLFCHGPIHLNTQGKISSARWWDTESTKGSLKPFCLSHVSHCQFLYSTTPSFLRNLPASSSSMILADLPFWFRNVKAKFLLLPQSILIIQIIRKVTRMLKYLIRDGYFIHNFQPGMIWICVVPLFFSFTFA